MLPCSLKHNHTFSCVRPADHYKTFLWLPSVCTNPWGFITRAIIHWCLETPSCALWIWGVYPLVHYPFCARPFRCIPAFLAPPFITYKTNLYHLLGQTTPILSSWWYMFILGDLSKNQSLIWFRWHIKPEDYRLPLDIYSNCWLPQTQFPNWSPKS
jgi:hypothetical protein